ncbi:MAG: hypothetical protein R8M38_09355 [Mariprofundaceae bacterium]
MESVWLEFAHTFNRSQNFSAIEGFDSDNDGFTNIEKINAAGGGTYPSSPAQKPAVSYAGGVTASLEGTGSSATVSSAAGSTLSDVTVSPMEGSDVIVSEGQVFVGDMSVAFTVEGPGVHVVTLSFSDGSAISANTVVHYMDENGMWTPLAPSTWEANATAIDITIVDGDIADMDGGVNSSIGARFAVERTALTAGTGGGAGGGEGGCLTGGSNTVFFMLLLLLVSAIRFQSRASS